MLHEFVGKTQRAVERRGPPETCTVCQPSLQSHTIADLAAPPLPWDPWPPGASALTCIGNPAARPTFFFTLIF